MGSQSVEYLVPSSIEDAVALRVRYGGDARFISGGTEVVPLMNRGKFKEKYLIELSRLEGLRVFKADGDAFRIGSAISLSHIEHAAEMVGAWTALSESAGSIREPQVRNRGTIGGNVAHGVPSADLIPSLLALDATLVLRGGAGERHVPVEDFLIGPYKTTLRNDELVAEIRLPMPDGRRGSAFVKQTKFGGSGLSIATVAAATRAVGGRMSAVRIAIGSAGPCPRRIRGAEEFLEGQEPTEAVLAEAGRMVSAAAEPRDGSIRASPAHRRRVLVPLTQRAMALAFQRSLGV